VAPGVGRLGRFGLPLAERSFSSCLKLAEEVELIASRGAIGVWLAEQVCAFP